jgi:3-deoxy-D-manno-octulosonic acid kinase
MAIEIENTRAGSILYDSERTGKPDERAFSTEYWEQRQQVAARARGRGGVIFIRDGERHWVLRHYRRGGLAAKVMSDTYLWTGLENTRAFREWRLLHELRNQGFPVPAPVAARVTRSGVFYRADLLTEALPPSRTLADSITGAQLPETVWYAVGRTLAKFLRAGVMHADLNAHNILIGESGTVFLLDFDRGEIRAHGPWEREIVARLLRSLQKIKRQRERVHFDERDWEALMGGLRSDS